MARARISLRDLLTWWRMGDVMRLETLHCTENTKLYIVCEIAVS